MSFERVPAIRAVLGESPVWLADESLLLWVDMPTGRIHRTDPAAGVTSTLEVPAYLGAAWPRAGSGLIAAVGEGFASISAGGVYRLIDDFLPPEQRMNDAKCDPFGNFVAGSLDRGFRIGSGALHWLNEAGERRVLVEGLTQPNGMAWSGDGRTFYLVDTAERELCSFAYDGRGCLSDRRLVRSFPESEGFADGMTIDDEGGLWIAMWDGAQLQRVAPDGSVLTRIDLPVARPTSCAFVGPQLDVLAVTIADQESSAEGGLALLDVGSSGVASVPFGNTTPV